jgi:5-methylcytosine-specific restriction endonuclease McrA
MPEQHISAELRQRVIERARSCCEYCRGQAKYATQSLSVEHILARTKGGTTTLDNLALACQGCNNHKYDKMEVRRPADLGTHNHRHD